MYLLHSTYLNHFCLVQGMLKYNVSLNFIYWYTYFRGSLITRSMLSEKGFFFTNIERNVQKIQNVSKLYDLPRENHQQNKHENSEFHLR